MEIFACLDCGINKDFPVGLRSRSETYRCFECFSKQPPISSTNVKVVVKDGVVELVDCPPWMNYKVIDYDVIENGDSDEFETAEQADRFLDNLEKPYQLIIVVHGGIAEVYNCPAEVEVEILDYDN